MNYTLRHLIGATLSIMLVLPVFANITPCEISNRTIKKESAGYYVNCAQNTYIPSSFFFSIKSGFIVPNQCLLAVKLESHVMKIQISPLKICNNWASSKQIKSCMITISSEEDEKSYYYFANNIWGI